MESKTNVSSNWKSFLRVDANNTALFHFLTYELSSLRVWCLSGQSKCFQDCRIPKNIIPLLFTLVWVLSRWTIIKVKLAQIAVWLLIRSVAHKVVMTLLRWPRCVMKTIYCHFAPGEWGLQCIASLYVCLWVCLSVCSHISKTTCPTFTNSLYMLPVAVARFSSDDNAIRCVLPVLWITSC